MGDQEVSQAAVPNESAAAPPAPTEGAADGGGGGGGIGGAFANAGTNMKNKISDVIDKIPRKWTQCFPYSRAQPCWHDIYSYSYIGKISTFLFYESSKSLKTKSSHARTMW